MSIKESALTAITSIAQSDFIRAVTSAGASRRITIANLAKAIIEQYTGSSLAGSSQSVKSAIDSLNSKTATSVAQPSSTPEAITLGATWDVYALHDSHFATLQMNFNVTAATSGTNIDVVTLPAAVKPKRSVYKIAITQSGSPYILNVTVGGVLRLYFFNTISSSVFLRETFTYSLA